MSMGKEAFRSTGVAGVARVPISTPDEDGEETSAEEAVMVAGISGYIEMQLEAMKAQIREVEIRRKLADQTDPRAGGEGGGS